MVISCKYFLIVKQSILEWFSHESARIAESRLRNKYPKRFLYGKKVQASKKEGGGEEREAMKRKEWRDIIYRRGGSGAACYA